MKKIIVLIGMCISLSGCSENNFQMNINQSKDSPIDANLITSSETKESQVASEIEARKTRKAQPEYQQSSIDIQLQENELNPIKVFTRSVHPSLPQYIFKLYGEKDEYYTTVKKIRIYKETTESKGLIQEIIIEDSKAPNTLDTAGVSIEDVNFDGYNDIMVQGTGAAGPNVPYYFWLWDKDSSKFIASVELNGLLSPEIDYKNKIIISSNSSSGGAYYTESYYKFINGKFTLVKEIERVVDINAKLFNYTVKELVNNKMKVVKLYSEPYKE